MQLYTNHSAVIEIKSGVGYISEVLHYPVSTGIEKRSSLARDLLIDPG